MPYDLGVWSEREGGDWEACVISSYLEGMVWGGVTNFPLGVYSQAEREALERIPDEPQDYDTTDVVALARYGVKLRRLSVGTVAAAVSRPGVGVVLAGWGGLLIPTTAPIHSVFWVDGLVYDPLAPNQSAGQPCSAARITGWAKGAGPNDAREVRFNEFGAAGDDMTIIVDAVKFLGADGKPAPRQVGFAAGVTITGYQLDGTSEKFTAGGGGSSAPADARCAISGRPDAPVGAPFVRITAGVFADHPYLLETQPGLTVAPDPPISGGGDGFTQEDLDKAEQKGKLEGAAARDAQWESKISASHHP
jgi:hypothetical protein